MTAECHRCNVSVFVTDDDEADWWAAWHDHFNHGDPFPDLFLFPSTDYGRASLSIVR